MLDQDPILDYYLELTMRHDRERLARPISETTYLRRGRRRSARRLTR